MKHVYPVRHPASLDAAPQGRDDRVARPPARAVAAARAGRIQPSQASASPQQKEVGRKAYDNATDGSADTDKGPVMDQVYNEKVAPRSHTRSGRAIEPPRAVGSVAGLAAILGPGGAAIRVRPPGSFK